MLQVQEVGYGYGHRSWWRSRSESDFVLKRVSFELESACCLGLLGTSGAGKSTLGRVVLGLQKPHQGQVLFEGRDLYAAGGRLRKTLRREVQVVFQDCHSSVNPLMTADQIIGEPLRNYERLSARELKRRTGELLEQVGLSIDDGSKRPDQFSGGQLQRINIARAIALRPKLIVLDEPVSSLDRMHQSLILDLLAELKASLGVSYLFITHDIQAAMTLCDRVAVMDRGEIVHLTDSPDSLRDSGQTAVRDLIEAVLPEHPADRLTLF
ncbi:ATP-binding cassette domain-containing protein [Saccharibacillus alkalitolerans]|uniref:ATP-binding cassette domain-containing protein n=1 Tax=Saccharibacillus alkalitolerans TaxID=2705290 RepID=A0ABX0F4U9_9BACL|nr:ATP-binding cassette domain-containing protein [Saccharibacillus alkalitolerans]NGZ75039.1 ATP-binding cassette domain-containing protein [Saccharibacillus alkalitolerans]